MRRTSRLAAGCTLGSLLVAAGCLTPSPPSRFYQLVPTVAEATDSDAAGEVVVGPVTLPAYLDRPQLVTRASEVRLELAEFDRWAEPLEANAARVLVSDLAAALPAMRVVPRGEGTGGAWRVEVAVVRYECGPGEACVLDVRWSLAGPDGPVGSAARAARFRAEAEGSGFEARAAAMSELLARLAGEIAAGIASAAAR